MVEYREGQTATNPTTGQKVVYEKGQWVSAPNSPARVLKAPEEASLKEAREGASNAINVLGDLTRFQDINARESTGGLGGLPWVRKAREAFDPDVQQMSEITSRLAPAQRQPGAGTTSDRDLTLYLQAVPGMTRSREANTAIIERARAEAVRRQQYADFLDDYVEKNGTLKGVEKAFRTKIGLGSRQTPYLGEEADPTSMPRGAYYRDPQGNLRRNDNGSRGNPIVEKTATAKPPAAKTPAGLSGVTDGDLKKALGL